MENMTNQQSSILQIGVIGSYSDLNYSQKLEKLAYQLGNEIARKQAALIVGGEEDGGLTRAAAKGAREKGGLVIGIMPNKKDSCQSVDIIIQTGGLVGLREYFIAINCDAIIAINGGSGTLNEITVAYQNNIPVVMLENSGGWSQKLSNTFLDSRKRYRFFSARTPETAVRKAIKLARQL